MILLCLLSALLIQPPSKPTTENDPMPLPSLDVLVGTWTFEWNFPDSPLGNGGKIEGTETYTRLTAPVKLQKIAGYPDLPAKSVPAIGDNMAAYQSLTTGTGPDGPIRMRALLVFDPATRIVTRVEADSRGFSTIKKGPIGGDLGGYYSIFWESSPIALKGRTVTLKGRTILYSPVSIRIENRISIDSGRLMDYGRPWYKKTESPAR